MKFKKLILASLLLGCSKTMNRFGVLGRAFSTLRLFSLILISVATSNAATLVWDANPPEDEVTHYTVYLTSSLGAAPPFVTSTTTYPLDSLQPGISYSIGVTATSPMGESDPAYITYLIPAAPVIETQPESKSIALGSVLQLTVVATGTPPLSYQWYRNGIPLASQTSQNLSISPVTALDAGSYTVIVSNSTGSSPESAPAVVAVLNPPTIAQQPSSVSVAAGARFLLTVTAGGSTPLSYQWFRNNQAISGAQSPNYEVLSASSANAGTYHVRVTNLVGSVQSSSVTVTVEAVPQITSHPQSVTVSQGSQIALAVTAAGSPPLTYQWYKNGSILAGRTTANLVISSAATSDAGTYHVQVSNAFGSAPSNPATVTVQTQTAAPSIVTQPQPVTVGIGAPILLEVLASGSSLSYQWFKNDVAIAGQTGAQFSIAAASENDAGRYKVTVSNSAGSVTSSSAVVAVTVPPSITKQPAGTNVYSGGSLLLEVVATGTGPLVYEWYLEGQIVAGASQNILNISPVTLAHSGSYRVRISNAAGFTNSVSVDVNVLPPIGEVPTIIAQPQSISVNAGDQVRLEVQAQSTESMEYQWFKNGQAMAGRTASTLVLTTTSPSDAGSYKVRVSNRFGQVESESATLTVITLPRIVAQPVSAEVRLGTSFELSVTASSLTPLSYQWSKDGVDISGATASTYRVVSAANSNLGLYRVKVSNASGFVLSDQVSVSLATTPLITRQPSDIVVNEGAELFLSFEVSGAGPFTVEWLRDNVSIGTTNRTELFIPAAALTDAGQYVARVSGPGGTVNTLPADVSIVAKPVITSQPVGRALTIGSSATLTVSASSESALTYQWFKDGQPIAGARNLFYSVVIQTDADYGTYTVHVSNSAGTTVSDPALIDRIAPPTITVQPSGVTVVQGAPFALSVTAQGSNPLSYQWFKDGTAIPGATQHQFSVSAATGANAGSYRVRISNSLGTIESSSVTVTVQNALTITQQPLGTNVIVGTGFSLSVVASGPSGITYQWYKDNVAIENAITPILTLSDTKLGDSGSYHVVVRTAAQSVSSNPAVVDIDPHPAGVLEISATGGVDIVGQGEPGAAYDVQVSGDLRSTNWITIQRVTADGNGNFVIQPPGTGSGFWFIRTVRR